MKKGIVLLIIVLFIGGYFFMSETNDSTEDDSEQSPDVAELTNDETEIPMSFFITSRNPGTGANLGGLAGADAHCQALAAEVDAGDTTWRAYLSATADGDLDVIVNARDRIGVGPWHNANGVLIAESIEDLHSDKNNLNKETALDENGNTVNGRGDTPNVHDILTGSNMDGTLAINEDGSDTTCNDWTSESADGSAVVGHHDRVGINDSAAMRSWVSSHGSRGCSLENLNSTGGGGLIYCFAED